MTSPRVSLLLGIHNHQPVDNWDHVLQKATDTCYRPFLEVLDSHPGVKMSVHYTGYLLDWLAARHPELITLLKKMVDRKQVELFTGGMYEPILSIIPDDDKLGQIQRLTQRVTELLDAKPQGLWLAERVWEPHLAQFLAEAGVRYVCLDDSHFISVGLDDAELLGRYTTEEQGKTLDIFPISKHMRYLIPYETPEGILAYLKSIATPEGDRAAVYFDDGEKFGVWPGTYQSVYGEKWLDRFFGMIEANADIIDCQLFSDYVAKTPSFGRVYLPTASYSEMLTWALPARHVNELEHLQHEAPPEYQRFLRGGFWRHYLVKYPESNNLHKKMQYVSRKIRLLSQQDPANGQAASNHLWQGQSNDAYWHGVFGGLYLTNLRTATYKHLLLAENLADSILNPGHNVRLSSLDFDCDQQPEILIETPHQNLYLDPDEGGILFELDYRPKAFNLLDTLARRYEPYHDKLALAVLDGDDCAGAKTIHERVVTKEKNLERLLHYDRHRRASLVDHFLPPDATLDKLYQVQFEEQGDFINRPYAVMSASGDTVALARTGLVCSGGKQVPVRVQKTVQVSAQAAQTRIEYLLSNEGSDSVDLWFSPEFNVNLLAPDAPDRYYRLPDADGSVDQGGGSVAVAEKTAVLTDARMVSKGSLDNIPAIELVDEWLGLTYQLRFDRPTTVWRFPIETVSQSEAGFERVYQSSVLMPHWQLQLAPGQQESIVITQMISG